MENPFVLTPYVSDDLFCDREQETAKLTNLIEGGSNVTLISPRRFGKTGLILRALSKLRDKGFSTCHIDLFPTATTDDFIKALSEAVAQSVAKESVLAAFMKKLASVRPLLSYDSVTGAPQITFTFVSDDDRRQTLAQILSFLESREGRVVVAFDEFQQIREYGGINMEALLRSQIQNLHNVNFIFSGSKKHLMSDMFSNAGNPFYESTRMLFLDRISEESYSEFIRNLFNRGNVSISKEAIKFVLDWTMRHTFYTQTLCHALFDTGDNEIDIAKAQECAYALLEENEQRLLEIRNLLTKGQWKMLKAIAKEEVVPQPTSGAFLQKYGITSGSSALRTLRFLLDKELVLETNSSKGKSYRVHNVLLLRYLERQ